MGVTYSPLTIEFKILTVVFFIMSLITRFLDVFMY